MGHSGPRPASHALWFGSFPPEAGSTQALCGNWVLILQWHGSRPGLIFGGGVTPLEEIGQFSLVWPLAPRLSCLAFCVCQDGGLLPSGCGGDLSVSRVPSSASWLLSWEGRQWGWPCDLLSFCLHPCQAGWGGCCLVSGAKVTTFVKSRIHAWCPVGAADCVGVVAE